MYVRNIFQEEVELRIINKEQALKVDSRDPEQGEKCSSKQREQ